MYRKAAGIDPSADAFHTCPQKSPPRLGADLTSEHQPVILNMKRALPADGWPLSHVIEVIAELLGMGRRSLLFCDLENQTNDADNHKTELKQV